MKTPADFPSLQTFLDAIAGGVGYLDGGSYEVTEQLYIRSGTTIYGPGKFHTSNPAASIINERCSADLESRADRDIRLLGITFERIPVALCGIESLLVRDCRFIGQPVDALQAVNNVAMRIDANEFANWGSTVHNGPPGTYVGGSAIFCWRPSWRSWITNNDIHDGAGGIWLPVDNFLDRFTHPAECIVCTGNIISRTTEMGIVSSPALSVVANNIMCDQVTVDVSGHGSENHGRRFVYANNVHARVQQCGAFFGNPEQVAISGNLFADTGGPALQISSVDPSTGMGANQPNHLSIIGNAGSDIAFGSLDGRKIDHCVTTGNAMTTTVQAGVKGKVFVERNNL